MAAGNDPQPSRRFVPAGIPARQQEPEGQAARREQHGAYVEFLTTSPDPPDTEMGPTLLPTTDAVALNSPPSLEEAMQIAPSVWVGASTGGCVGVVGKQVGGREERVWQNQQNGSKEEHPSCWPSLVWCSALL